TIAGSQGSITIRPLSMSPRIVASERTEEGCKSAVTFGFALYDGGMPNIGPLELIIVLVIILVIFGPKRLPGLGRSLGSGMREFKDSISGKDEPGAKQEKSPDPERIEPTADSAPPPADAAPPATPPLGRHRPG